MTTNITLGTWAPMHLLTTCLLFILAFAHCIPPASQSSAVYITSCLLQPSFTPGQPPSVVFATPPPPQMNPTPQPRQVGLPTAPPAHSTRTLRNSRKKYLFHHISEAVVPKILKQLFGCRNLSLLTQFIELSSVEHYESNTSSVLFPNHHFCLMSDRQTNQDKELEWVSWSFILVANVPVCKFGIIAAHCRYLKSSQWRT